METFNAEPERERESEGDINIQFDLVFDIYLQQQ